MASAIPTTVRQPRQAAIYTRVSLDATGEGLAVTRQEEDARKLIADRGWQLVGIWSDNSISASDARKVRPGYNELVKSYAAEQFDALVCYDLDRLTRQPRQLEDWIDAAESRDLALVTTNGEADLTTDGGRMFARIKAAVARAEVERKGARQKAANFQRVKNGGAPRGVRLMGYSTKGETIAAEAEVVRRIFALFSQGESLNGIVRALNTANTPTRHGSPWTMTSVRNILTNARYCGRTFYNGQIIEGVRGNWESLVSEDEFDLVQAKLSDPQRTTRRVGTDRRHLGSGLYLCGDCGEAVTTYSGGRYGCKSRCVNRAKTAVDRYVTDVVAERLSRSDLVTLLAPAEQATAPILDEVKRLRSRLEAVNAEYDADIIDGVRWRSKSERIKAELARVEQTLATSRSGSALAPLLDSPDPSEAFLSAPVMAQRAVVDALCVVRLLRGVRGVRVFDPASVVIEWRR